MANEKYVLPYGDNLRDLLNDSLITKSDLRAILRKRGVFTYADEKPDQVPLIVRTGVTPKEFVDILEKVKTKEENPKLQTQTVKCIKGDHTLKAMLPANLDLSRVINKPFSNYKLIGFPSFKTIDGDSDNIELAFTIERYDYSKSWDKNTTLFSGKVRLKKEKDSVDVNISLSHTSSETKEVASAITSTLINEMKSSGFIDKKEELKKILFSDFSNENRVLFLQRVSQNPIDCELYFKDTKDIGFSPDESQKLPAEMSWMEKKISTLILKGSGLHSTFFVQDKALHKYIKLHTLEADYTFDYANFSGTCHITFDFPEFSIKKDVKSELAIRVNSIKFKKKEGISTSKVKEMLLSQLDKAKIKYYEMYSDKVKTTQ
ncbi:GapS4b family protein [Aeromonas hydrophila]|uniref:GapS4b family protein n=1 Tax=Aeromonas hydrophila TaxID=644 RepID=UPI0007601534|nr:hypothetical protein [Aeromonas hydrophila]KWR65383.1 hypothetical protein ATO50_20715 [Aeromonas hydrophila]HAU4930604.1 hypothetical protein [Aeromonas hydrophila]